MKTHKPLVPIAMAAALSSSSADILVDTDFSGRTVTGKTASTITWTVDGVQDPGGLTAVDEAPTNAAFAALFDSANAQGHFAPDKNTGNEGPWSVTIPLTLTETEITIEDVVLDWQNFNNAGAFQGPSAGRKVDWTVTVTGSTSGQVGMEMVQVDGVSGVETLTFTSPLTLTDAETWDVKILAEGGEATGNNTGLDGITINGTAGPDMDPPLITTLDPADDTPKVAVGTNLVATFNETIAVGTGNITIKESVGDAIVEMLDVTSSPGITFGTTTVTIDPASDLGGDTGYYIEIDATAIDDAAGNSFAGITDKTTWNFTTDGTAPMTVALSNNGGTNVSAIDALSVTFDEDVFLGTGNVVIKRVSDGSVVETIDVTMGGVLVSGDTATITPAAPLPVGTEVYIEIDAGVFEDLVGNPFAGISGSGTWSFTTDGTPPMVVTLSNNGATGVPIGAGLELTFDEDVLTGAGNVVVKRLSDDMVLATIDVATGIVDVDGDRATVFSAVLLPVNTEVYVEVDAGTFEDASGNAIAGFSGSATWNFTTGSAANLLAHYKFDEDNTGTTPDAIGSNFATLGNRVQINTTGGVPLAGDGALEMLGLGAAVGPGDGAVTSNIFGWPNDARTVTFWWKARTPNVDENDGTFVSFGTSEMPPDGNGKRFDIKEQGASSTSLRVEVQGTGQNTNPAIDDGAWHFIAVVVPNNATFADIAWYVDGSTTNLNTSVNVLDIITGAGPMVFGDSILDFGANTRVPDGFLDDVQVYGSVLDQSQFEFLFNNPGCVIGDNCGVTGLKFTVAANGAKLDFSWVSEDGKQYDLLSSDDPATEMDPSAWMPYNDGSTTHVDLPASGTGTNTLTNIPRMGPDRYFVIREEDIPPLLSEDFEADDGEFVEAQKGLVTLWEYGAPNSASQFGSAILAGNGGSARCWGTDLDSGYAAGTDTCLRSPVINLTGITGAQLSFAQAMDIEAGHTFVVNVIDDMTDTVIESAIHTSTPDVDQAAANWETISGITIAGGEPVRIEWRFTGEGDGNYNGAYIDDVVVTRP